MLFYIVDAFTDIVFGGNAAGVVIYDNLGDEKMQSIAAEFRFSETVFVKPLDCKNFDVRFFTPVSEVSLCGHGTIAAFGAMLYSKMVEENSIYNMNTKSGVLSVFIRDGLIMMEQACPAAGSVITAYEELEAALGISKDEIGDVKYHLKPQAMSTGLFDIILPVKSRASLNSINPDFSLLAKLSNLYRVVGLHAFTLDSGFYTACCRNFAPLYGIDEEAATGTSNCALTYYLYMNNIIHELDKDYVFLQGEKLNRPSEIITRLKYKDELCVLCGGTYRILAHGQLCI